ncbi:hypothetical protein ANCCAN_22958 [Ancylostoma caninum]|uniref:Uncharacterized protein n=1 Tax=Ancylostoma caninum TaxID=29170 RepID=A0A368FGS3_ANCCA|nr:hypothetical protein ANCCAN_22958 [Ancylostoma caninum]
MGSWLEARMSPGLTFLLQVIMVGVVVLDVVLGIVGIVVYAVQSKKIAKKLRLQVISFTVQASCYRNSESAARNFGCVFRINSLASFTPCDTDVQTSLNLVHIPKA